MTAHSALRHNSVIPSSSTDRSMHVHCTILQFTYFYFHGSQVMCILLSRFVGPDHNVHPDIQLLECYAGWVRLADLCL
jgi:hypothetical protein